ncbi:MAG: hypothetical protein IKC75_05510 [Clostridia bacterium]|nr:hypothetical protein [Clostridia bacterium]
MNENQKDFEVNAKNEISEAETPEVSRVTPEAAQEQAQSAPAVEEAAACTAPEAVQEQAQSAPAVEEAAACTAPEAAQASKDAPAVSQAPRQESQKSEKDAPAAESSKEGEQVKDEEAAPAAEAPKQEAEPQKPAEATTEAKGKGKKAKKEKKPKKQKRLRKKHPVLRVFGAFFRFTLTLLLGMAIAYGSLVGIVYYAFSGLTIDTLQRFGIAKNADTYLTGNGEVDLTGMSILELVADLNTVRADLANHSLGSLIERYGLNLPEETMAKLPTDLFELPLSEFASGDVGGVIANNLKFGYILSLLPPDMLGEDLKNVLASRPLSLLTSGEYGALFEGIKLGYLMGVSFDENGNVVCADPEHPTLQEVIGTLDLGHVLTAVSKNGDILGVLATDIGNSELRPLLSGIISGALLDKMCEGTLIKDVILPDPETGRYRFELEALAGGAMIGDVLGYTFVQGTWYTTYTDNNDATDDVVAPKINATIAEISLGAIIAGNVQLEQAFDDVYFGDLQSGFVRGDAITEENPEGGDPIVVGYQWLKDGNPVGKMQQQLANIAANDLIGGNLDVNEVLGSLYVGDLQGYRAVEEYDSETGELISRKWMKTEGETEVEVSAVLSAVANISISAMLNGELDITATLGSLTFGEVQGFVLGEDGLWYREVQGESGIELQYVGAMQNSLAGILLSDVLNGGFDLSECFSSLYFGDLQAGYVRGEEITENDLETGAPVVVGYKWTKDGEPVGKMQQELANIAVADLLNGNLDISATLGGLTVGDLQGYTRVDILDKDTGDVIGHQWMKSEGDTLVEVGAVMSAIADVAVSDMLEGKLDLAAALGDLKLGDVQGYILGEDGHWYQEVTGEDGTSLEKVSAVQNSIASVSLSNVMNGEFSLTDATKDLLMGEAMGYIRGDVIPSEDPEAPVKYAFTKKDQTPVTGTMLEMANLSLADVLNGNVDFEDTVKGMTLAEVLGLTEAQDGWQDENGERVTGILAVLAEKKINEINAETIDGIAFGEILGYTYKQDTWYDGDTPATGMTGKLAGLTLGDLSNDDAVMTKLRELTLADAMGYTYDEENGVWLDQNKNELTGVLKALAGQPLNEINSSTIDAILLGDALGYTYDKQNGVWLGKDGQPVTGVLKVLVGKRIDELNGATFDAIRIGDVLGYIYNEEGDVWYEGDAPATGIMATLASLTLGDLSNDDTVAEKLRELTLAEAMGYTYDEERGVWLDGDQNEITGILKVLANKPLDSINSATIEEIKLGDALGYTEGENGVWYQGTAPATGIVSKMVGLSVGDLKNSSLVAEKLSELQLYEVLDYKKVGNQWQNKEGRTVSGVIAYLLETPVGGMEERINVMPLGYAFGFHYDETDGKWYTNATNKIEPSGITASFVNIHLGNAKTELEGMKMGDLLGYTHKDTNADDIPDTWYDKNSPVEGLNLVLVDLSITELGNEDKIAGAMQKATLGSSLGFKKAKLEGDTEARWYKTKLDGSGNTVVDPTEPVTGLMGALADKKIGGLEDEIESVSIGTMLDFTEKSDGWYDKNGNKVTGAMAVLSKSDLSSISDNIQNMKVADMWPEREGILSAIDGETKINELDQAVENCTVGALINAGVINVKPTQAAFFDIKISGWRDLNAVGFINALLGLVG